MTAKAAVGIDDDLAAGETRVAHGAAHDKATGGVHVQIGPAPIDALGIHDGRDDVLHHVLLDDVHVLDLGRMLGGDNDGVHAHGTAALVAHGHLGLAVGTQVRQGAVVAHLGEALGQTARKIVRHGHKRRGLVGGIAEHHALIARTDKIDGVGGLARLGLIRLIDTLGDIGALLMDKAHDAAGLAVKTKLGAVVPDATDGIARDLLDIHVCLGANLAGNDDGAGGDKRLARAAHVVYVGGNAVGRNVSLRLELGLLEENRVQDGVGNLIGDLVGMSLGYRFGRKDERPGIGSGTILQWHGMPLSSSARRPLPFRRAMYAVAHCTPKAGLQTCTLPRSPASAC